MGITKDKQTLFARIDELKRELEALRDDIAENVHEEATWTREYITISVSGFGSGEKLWGKPQQSKSVEAWLSPSEEIAYHVSDRPDYDYAVTHVPSGFAFGYFDDDDVARAVAYALEESDLDFDYDQTISAWDALKLYFKHAVNPLIREVRNDHE